MKERALTYEEFIALAKANYTKGGDGYVAAREQFAVHFDAHPVAELIEQQCLLYFRKADFPGKTGMVATGAWRCSCTSVIAADEYDVGASFDNACCNGADTNFRNELDTYASVRISIFEVMDKFRQVLNGVDIVMRRRRY